MTIPLITTDPENLATLRESAEAWVREAAAVEADPTRAREAAATHWRAIAALGWAGASVAAEAEGLGLGPAATGALLEALGATLTPTPLLSTGLIATAALTMAGDEAGKTLLPALAAGDAVFAFAADEGPRHGGPIETVAARDGAQWRLTGHKRFVLDAQGADWLIVAAQAPDGLDHFLVAASEAAITPLDLVDGRGFGAVLLDDVAATARLGIGTAGHEWLCDLARIGLAAEMVGAAGGALAATVDYLTLREQFGRPIGSFQALQHRAAEMQIDLALARAALAAAWEAAERQTGALPALAALAKFTAGEALHRIGSEMVQMHGGIGMTAEHPAGRTLKWARVSETLFGNASWCADRYATLSGY